MDDKNFQQQFSSVLRVLLIVAGGQQTQLGAKIVQLVVAADMLVLMKECGLTNIPQRRQLSDQRISRVDRTDITQSEILQRRKLLVGNAL